MKSLPKIEDVDFYIEKNLKAMESTASKFKLDIDKRFKRLAKYQKKEREVVVLDKTKDIELEKIRFLKFRLIRDLSKIIKSYRFCSKLDSLSVALFETFDVELKDVEQSLYDLENVIDKIEDLEDVTEGKIKKAKTTQTIGFVVNKHLGKTFGFFKRNRKSFEVLEHFRVVHRKLPSFKDIFTASIVGLPNVGKSSLLRELTGSEVEIQPYPFTTKGLMMGYLELYGIRKIQLVDTPGLLAREKKNEIEQRATLIAQRKANLLIYVFDLSLTCGYDLEKQKYLFNYMKKFEKSTLVYFSKTDLYKEIEFENKELLIEELGLRDNFLLFDDSDELREYLLKLKTVSF